MVPQPIRVLVVDPRTAQAVLARTAYRSTGQSPESLPLPARAPYRGRVSRYVAPTFPPRPTLFAKGRSAFGNPFWRAHAEPILDLQQSKRKTSILPLSQNSHLRGSRSAGDERDGSHSRSGKKRGLFGGLLKGRSSKGDKGDGKLQGRVTSGAIFEKLTDVPALLVCASRRQFLRPWIHCRD